MRPAEETGPSDARPQHQADNKPDLGTLGLEPETVVPALFEAIEERQPTRNYALRALGNVGLGPRGKWVLVYFLPAALPLLAIAMMAYGVKKPGSWGEKQQL